MFTGIVQGTAKLVSIDEKPNFRTHVVELPDHMLDGLETGASVAHNGCCLTVTEINGNHVSFDLMKETLRITNLGDLKVGDWVNVERAAILSLFLSARKHHILLLLPKKEGIKKQKHIDKGYTSPAFSQLHPDHSAAH